MSFSVVRLDFEQFARADADSDGEDRQRIGNILDCAAIGDQQIIGGMKGDCRTQKTSRSRNSKPAALPHIRKAEAHQRPADNVHGTRTKPANEQK